MGSSQSDDSKQITVKVTCSHNGQSVDINQHRARPITVSWTTAEVKEAIQEITYVHHRCQRLMYAGKEMGPADTILSIAGPTLEHIPDKVALWLNVQHGFPQTLGPFSPARVPFEAGDFMMPELKEVFRQNGFYWEMKTGILESHGLCARVSCITGQVSPVQPLILEAAQREALAIPAEAVEFAWSYPVCNWQRVESDAYALDNWDGDVGLLEGSVAMKSFLSCGGFMYFDAKGAVAGTTTLGRPEEGVPGALRFGEPQKWAREWTVALVERGRFQVVTTKALMDFGAQHFCWLRPSEIIEGSDGAPLAAQPEVPLGGFVYLFHENMLSQDSADLALDRFFPVIQAVPQESPDKRPSLFRPYTLIESPEPGEASVEPIEGAAQDVALGTTGELCEKRIDPTLGDAKVTFAEMCQRHSDKSWSEADMQSHWTRLQLAEPISYALPIHNLDESFATTLTPP